jgi:hypothetical protein
MHKNINIKKMQKIITFKKVYTGIVRQYNLNIQKPLQNIYLELDNRIKSDFNCTNFELVIAGTNLMERADPIPRNCNRTINNLMKHDSIAFYIRVIENSISQECPVCLNTIECRRHYLCNHSLCNGCHTRWSTTNQRNALLCPICRSN